MQTIKNVLYTIIAIPLAIVIGLVVGLFLFVLAPFYVFSKIYEDIWGYADVSTDY